jgi:uncharacterized protein
MNEHSKFELRQPAGLEVAGEKQRTLFANLRVGSLLVAFSGGADSAYLAWAAHRVLGDRALAVTAISPSFSAEDRKHVLQFVADWRLPHHFIQTHEFDNPLYVANDKDRCFHCKAELFDRMQSVRESRNFNAIAYGVNADDLRDFRPGHRAASQAGVLAPLLDVGLTKTEIRELSRNAGLSTWDRPASPCLSSRIPYGTTATVENLARVEEAESVLRGFGFRQFRVRYYGETAQIEISPDELPRALQPELKTAIIEAVRKVGFTNARLDPRGYRQGSLNAALTIL